MTGVSGPAAPARPGGARSATSLYEKLSPGPGRPAREVAAAQRARLRAAMIEAVAERGYRAVRVRELCALAQVSSHTFYEHFDDREDCLVGTCTAVVDQAADRVRASLRSAPDPEGRLRVGLETLIEGVVGNPAAARLALIEAPAAGPDVAAAVRRGEPRLAMLVEECFAGAAKAAAPSRHVAGAIVAGVLHVLRARLIADRAEELPMLASGLAEWAHGCGSGAAASLAEIGTAPPRRGRAAPEPPVPRVQLGDERAMILSAAARLAVKEGYEGLSVTRIRERAGVSRRIFDSHFTDLDDCFLTTCAVVGRRAIAEAVRQAAGAPSWAVGIQRALRVLFDMVAREPAYARLALLDPLDAGPEGVRVSVGVTSDVASLLVSTTPRDSRPPILAIEASVGAAWDIVAGKVAEGGERDLHLLVPLLSILLAAPVQGMASVARDLGADRRSADRSSMPAKRKRER